MSTVKSFYFNFNGEKLTVSHKKAKILTVSRFDPHIGPRTLLVPRSKHSPLISKAQRKL